MNAIKTYLQLNKDTLKKRKQDFRDRSTEELEYHERIVNVYNNWVSTIKKCMNKSAYRRVLAMITQMPIEFSDIQNKFDIELIRLRCIIKIIEHKTKKYELDYKENRLKEKKVIEFWINQLYFGINHIILEIRPDIKDNNINLSNEESRNKIEYVVILTLDSIYQLIIYSEVRDEIPQACAYFTMVTRLELFVPYCRNPKSLQSFQKITLLRAKVLIKNLDYENALVFIEKTLSFCFRQFFLLIDFDEGLNAHSLKDKRKGSNIIYMCFIHMAIAFYYRGICHEVYGKISKGIEAYKQSHYICRKFLIESYPLMGEFFDGLLNRALAYNKTMTDILNFNEQLMIKKSQKDEDKRLVEQNESEEKRIQKTLLEKIAKGENTRTTKRLDKTLQLINKMELNDIALSQIASFPKSKMMTTTVTLIDYLLSKSFRPIVKEMKTLEINCLDRDITRKIKKEIFNMHSKEDSFSTTLSNNQKKKMNVKMKIKKRLFSPSLISSSKHSGFASSRGLSIKSSPSLRFSSNKVERITIDNIYDKDYRAKKSYLENYNNKEVQFHKNLLKCKLSEVNGRPDEVNQQIIRNNVEEFFRLKLLVAKERDTKIQLKKFDSQKEYQVFGKQSKLRNKMIHSLSTKLLKENNEFLLFPFKGNTNGNSNNNKDKPKCLSSQESDELLSSINKENNDIIKRLDFDNLKLNMIKKTYRKSITKFNFKHSH